MKERLMLGNALAHPLSPPYIPFFSSFWKPESTKIRIVKAGKDGCFIYLMVHGQDCHVNNIVQHAY